MLVILIPIAFVVAWLFAYQYVRDGRMAALVAWTGMGATVVAANEILSLFHAIAFGPVLLVWLAFIACLAWPLMNRRSNGTLVRPPRIQFKPTWIEGALLLIAGFAVLCAFISGFCSPPNNWDSMTYKLPRVHYWIQHRSLEPFPTHITRHVELGPGAGYWMLHLQLLSGGFRWFFAVQWTAGILASIAASLLVREMGGNRTAQIIGACLVWSIPMAILQASSTQDDLTAGSWVMVFTLFAMRMIRTDGASEMSAWGLLAGCALGVGMVTKGTAYVFAFPFCVWFGVRWLRAPSRAMFRALALLSLVVVSMNAPFLSRNAAVFGHPLGGPQRIWISNQRHGLDVVYINLVRGFLVNFGGLDHSHNKHMEKRADAAVQLIDGNIDDPEITFPSGFFDLKHRYELPQWLWHEDWAPNPASIIASILAAGIVVLVLNGERRAFALATLGSGLLFCWAFRYQPWITRLQIPFYMLGCVPVALLAVRWQKTICGVASVLLLAASPAGPLNYLRPIVGERSVLFADRDATLFSHRPKWRHIYETLHERLVQLRPRSVGFVEDKESWEWPVMYYYNVKHSETPWFGHPWIWVETAALENREPWKSMKYDAIIMIDPQWFAEPPQLRRDYVEVFREGHVSLWKLAGS